MLCQNCGENEANVRYTQIINGVKKEMVLCEKCSKELGISNMDLSMPIDLSSFLGEFFEDTSNLLPEFESIKPLVCEECGMTYDEFLHTGKFGCANCYNVFGDKIDPLLKNLHGANRHIGRKGKESNLKLDKKVNEVNKDSEIKKVQISKLDKLKQDLKKAIKEERYEDAAKLRDEIKKLENKNE